MKKREIFYTVAGMLFILVGSIAVEHPTVAVVYNMLLSGTVVVLLHRLDVKSDQNLQKSATMLSEAGSAITDTLKIAFDNLKKVSVNISKNQAKLSDHEARLHRLEQSVQRAAAPSTKSEVVERVVEKQDMVMTPPWPPKGAKPLPPQRRQSPLNRPPSPPPSPPTK